MTQKELLKSNIVKQKKLLAGEEIKGQKGNMIKSWFNKETFNPKVGVHGLFGEAKYTCAKGNESQMLNDFEKALDAGEFDEYIKKIKIKITVKK